MTTFTPAQVNAAAARSNDVEAGDGPRAVRFLRELGLSMEPERPALPGTPGLVIVNVETDYDAPCEHAVLHEDGNW